MEVDGNDKDTVQGLISKDVDKKMSRAKAKEKKEKRKTLWAAEKTIRRGPQKLVRMVQETPEALGKARPLGQRRNRARTPQKRGGAPPRGNHQKTSTTTPRKTHTTTVAESAAKAARGAKQKTNRAPS